MEMKQPEASQPGNQDAVQQFDLIKEGSVKTMKKMWLVLILAASMLTGCVIAGGPPYYYDYYGYYGYGHGHEHGHGHGYDD